MRFVNFIVVRTLDLHIHVLCPHAVAVGCSLTGSNTMLPKPSSYGVQRILQSRRTVVGHGWRWRFISGITTPQIRCYRCPLWLCCAFEHVFFSTFQVSEKKWSSMHTDQSNASETIQIVLPARPSIQMSSAWPPVVHFRCFDSFPHGRFVVAKNGTTSTR